MRRVHVMHVPGADPVRDKAVAEMGDVFDVCLHADPDRRGAMTTWVEAMTCAASSPAEWNLVVQDDARVLGGTVEHLPVALDCSPSLVLGLSWIGKWASHGAAKRRCYVKGSNILQGVAVAYHGTVIGGMAAFARTVREADPTWVHDDLCANIYAEHVLNELPAVVSFPVLGYYTTRSLLGHGRYKEPAQTVDNLPVGFEWQPSFTTLNRYSDVATGRRLLRTVSDYLKEPVS